MHIVFQQTNAVVALHFSFFFAQLVCMLGMIVMVREGGIMKRTLFLLYGVLSYAVFFVTFLYLIGFLASAVVPKSIDSGAVMPLPEALVVNLCLLALFGLQHTLMARPSFKAQWTKIVPQPIERSTYTLLSSLLLILLYNQWRAIPDPVWQVETPSLRLLLQGLFYAGFLIVLYSSFLIDHFDLFGLRQVFLYWRGKPYAHHPFRTPGLYKWIRHPLYLGWFLAFWSTPHMSWGHLLFASVLSAYILFAIPFEERNLLEFLGDEYRAWRARTPLFLPLPRRRS